MIKNSYFQFYKNQRILSCYFYISGEEFMGFQYRGIGNGVHWFISNSFFGQWEV